MRVLVTGGAGYIGSHVVRALLQAGHETVVYDNLSTGHRQAVAAGVPFYEEDIRSTERLTEVLLAERIEAVIHFAASSLVGESMQEPQEYYDNNIGGTLSLLSAMRQAHVENLVFSSTAAVYGEPEDWPILESAVTCPTNVYGRTKLVIEGMLADFAAAYDLRYVSLRYFNAAGACENGEIGEDHGTETHLVPLILKTALGLRQAISIYGTDYETVDGTCIRDYIHVCDLAQAHVLALEHLGRGGESRIYNLGSEQGFSVRQVIETAKKVTQQEFTVEEAPRRAGDPAVLIASSAKIRQELDWQAQRSSLEMIVGDAWRWHKAHPKGYFKEKS
ncbi:UDP-glucose 4-epimerase GalE [Anaeromusa acidaminophila]|uniref:UDP-glucose 4-epimerase GalE n=1 Tax=Anaeromusa acidaminophila TaxID=81464 RepID=UPI00036D5CF0|nr:UDP-glucose 4-epimerase GalE [Anaeromusa acidaminophila]